MGSYQEALEAATAAGDVQTIAWILNTFPEAKAALRTDSEFTDNLLYTAIANGSGKVVKALLDGGIDPNTDYDYLGDALIYAVRQKHKEVVEVILDAGYQLNDVSKAWAGTVSPLAAAALVDTDTPAMTEILLAHGTVIKQTLALHTAARAGNLITMTFLLDKGADINELPEVDDRTYGCEDLLATPLHHAVDGEHLEAIKLLLDRGADVSIVDRKGRTLLQRREEISAWPALTELLEKHNQIRPWAPVADKLAFVQHRKTSLGWCIIGRNYELNVTSKNISKNATNLQKTPGSEAAESIKPESIHKNHFTKADEAPKTDALLAEQTVSNKEQRKADWAILKEMARYIWPKAR
ncbi:Ankyrin-2 [Xylographa opegraphella]|nr:Ankyrin-2 [Xylographa opegraphella]